ncbi:hypothetical protein, partial [Stenotrophomonas sp. GbtcB23]|uniref:hypothetical protein n=1 Tax=Stenotrophomonas sp. GbtcB23 TaxID=2824768 RepID=UPI001C30AB71
QAFATTANPRQPRAIQSVPVSRMSAMKEYLIFAAVCLLAGCTTMPPLTDGVTVSLRSYDSATGDYVLELDL